MIWRFLANLFLRLRRAAWKTVYETYRQRYSIHPTFEFKGLGVELYGEGRIQLLEHSYIGDYSTIQAAVGTEVRIGRYCSISHNVRIYTSTALADSDFTTG